VTQAKLLLQRRYTDTPLARQHERALNKGPARRLRAIPWQKFRRSDYPEPALALAAHEMRGLAMGEYLAVDQFSRLASALALNGAPLDVVSAAVQIPSDEVRHSDYALRFASLCAGREAAFEIGRPPYEKSFQKPVSLEQLDLLMIELPTISETLAAGLIQGCLELATDPVAHAVFASILSDEVHHLRLGWYYLAWRSPQWSRVERQRVADFAGEMLMNLEVQFWQGRDAPRGAKKAAAALGVLDSPRQRAWIRRIVKDELVPGLDALGLGASHAWRARKRASA
jgi:hypothetical protein